MKSDGGVFLILLVLVLSLSCTKTTQTKDTTIPLFDPGFPGGGDYTSSDKPLRGVLSLTDTSSPGNVRLDWKLPTFYKNQDSLVYIYRIDGDGSDFTLDDPESSYYSTINYLVESEDSYNPPTEDTPFYEDGSVQSGNTYTYLVYIKLGKRFSVEKRITVSVPTKQAVITIPSPDVFWQSYTTTYGGGSAAQSYLSYNSMGPGSVNPVLPEGRFAFHPSGGIMYFADTANNRVIIYKKQGFGTCDGETDPIKKAICEGQFSIAPFVAFGVIGQESQFDSYTCDEHLSMATPLLQAPQKECLTSPRSLAVNDNHLFIGDDNGRVLVFNTLPVFGCSNLIKDSQGSSERDCTPDKVIGKSGFSDFTPKDISLSGDADLQCPTDIAYNKIDDSLLIAESCRNRIVKVSNVSDNNLQNCTPSSFGLISCMFSAVMGQPDFFSNTSLNDLLQSGELVFNQSEESFTDSGARMSNYFGAPSRIRLTKDGKLYVGANENISIMGITGNYQLRGRILVWDSNPIEGESYPCIPSNFMVDGCQADHVIGQTSLNALNLVPFGNNYNALNFTFLNYDFDLVEDSMILANGDANAVHIYDTLDYSAEGVPYSGFVANPTMGQAKGDGTILPVFKNLNNVEYLDNTGDLYFGDTSQGLGRIYMIPIKN